MSYDLFFYRKEKSTPDVERIISYFKNRKYFKVPRSTKGDFQIWYENEDTGVYFSFDYKYPHKKEDNEDYTTTGYYNTGFSFTLNYAKPSFFAYEAMPIVETFVNEFQLLIADPQDEPKDDINRPKHYQADELIRSWERVNRATFIANEEIRAAKSYMPREKSRLWWQYTKEKNRLQEQLGGEIFVPAIFIFKKQRDIISSNNKSI